MRDLWTWLLGIGLCAPLISHAETPAPAAECDNLAEMRREGSRAYSDQRLPVEARLLRSEQFLQKALACCREDADCLNLTHFGLACVYEDQFRILLKKNQREAASQKLVSALNSYERYISQAPAAVPTSSELQLPSAVALTDDAPACPAPTGKLQKGKERQQFALNQALTGRDRLVAHVRPTHGRLLIQFPNNSLSFHINKAEYVVVKRPERPLPVWLPQGNYELTWNNGGSRATVDLRAGESVTQILGATPPPPSSPIRIETPTLSVQQLPPITDKPEPAKRTPYGLLIGGGTLVIAGVAMGSLGIAGLVLDGKCTEPACDYVYDGKVYGGAMLGVGVAALGVGATLLGVGLSQTRTNRPSLRVSLNSATGSTSLSAQGAF